MPLGALQTLLHEIYALDVAYDIRDFVTTDSQVAGALDTDGRNVDEKLLIAEESGEAEICLYLEEQLMARLTDNDPVHRLNGDNLADFWTAFEGISHFTYYAWNAAADKSVTLLEMELQAEVDKFVATSVLLHQQGERAQRGLHHWLFDRPRFDHRLAGAELDRYQRANRYAGKYCRQLGPRLARGLAGEELVRELRRFYRLPQPAKIEHIESR
jgi:hypothetical protein